MDAVQSTKRITRAMKTKRPEVFKPDTESLALQQTTQLLAAIPTYRVYVKVFVLSTGDDTGDNVDFRGYVRFLSFGNADQRSIYRDLPIFQNYADKNEGRGFVIYEDWKDTAFIPASFLAYVYDDDTGGDDICLNYSLDFTNPTYAQYADGRDWILLSRNSEEQNTAVHLQWRVEKLT